MKKLRLLFGLILISLFLVSGCFQHLECPESCDDNNICTIDTCSEETNFECHYTKRDPFCCHTNKDCESDKPYCISVGGFKICEDHECNYNSDCPISKPFCRDNICDTVQCKEDDDCNVITLNIDGHILLVRECVSNKCVQCRETKDCFFKCRDKWDCAGGEGTFGHYACKEGKCVKCKFDSDCDKPYNYCSISGICVSI